MSKINKFMAGIMLTGVIGAEANAAYIVMNFTAVRFPISEGQIAPDSQVSGTIVWEADSPTKDIKQLTSVKLTINGKTYKLEDVGFVNKVSSTGNSIIGGKLNDVTGIKSKTNDFLIEWNQESRHVEKFSYSTESQPGIWTTKKFRPFSIKKDR